VYIRDKRIKVERVGWDALIAYCQWFIVVCFFIILMYIEIESRLILGYLYAIAIWLLYLTWRVQKLEETVIVQEYLLDNAKELFLGTIEEKD